MKRFAGFLTACAVVGLLSVPAVAETSYGNGEKGDRSQGPSAGPSGRGGPASIDKSHPSTRGGNNGNKGATSSGGGGWGASMAGRGA